MSKINQLSAELKAIFGESFGDQVETPSLEESVESFFEGKNSKKAPFNAKVKADIKSNKKSAFPANVKKDVKAAVKQDRMPIVKAAAKKPEKKPAKAAPAKSAPKAAAGPSGGGGGKHHPFKRSPNLGLGPGTPGKPMGVGARHHDQAKCWKCNCPGGIYDNGCMCTGTGKSEDCPKGRKKKISFKPAYHRAYNDKYHAWRGAKRGTDQSITKRTADRGRAKSK